MNRLRYQFDWLMYMYLFICVCVCVFYTIGVIHINDFFFIMSVLLGYFIVISFSFFFFFLYFPGWWVCLKWPWIKSALIFYRHSFCSLFITHVYMQACKECVYAYTRSIILDVCVFDVPLPVVDLPHLLSIHPSVYYRICNVYVFPCPSFLLFHSL